MAVGGTTLGAPSLAAAALPSHSPVAAALTLHVEDAIINASSPMKVLLDAKQQRAKPKVTSQVSGAVWLHPTAHATKRGKEGSRRRRRYDNVHFTHHPLVAKHATDPDFVSRNDRSPGLPIPRPDSPFTVLPRALVAELPTIANASKSFEASADATTPLMVSLGEGNLSRTDRKLLKNVRRTRCGEEIVKRVDDEILARVFCVSNGGDASAPTVALTTPREAQDWVVLHPRRPEEPVLVPSAAQIAATPAAHVPPLCLEISDKFMRLIVHLMCRFYGLVSHSAYPRFFLLRFLRRVWEKEIADLGLLFFCLGHRHGRIWHAGHIYSSARFTVRGHQQQRR
ncbi:hypothetical protein BDZ88DRAFT_432935 [Geranomyces variabilis]|nr:hypothetical protein BDZ88DRAFT_432935 [Geranomyces variabilis]KAJ3140783.1 hypothetical protein HDU90_008088 [Geranomyces variabilis]